MCVPVRVWDGQALHKMIESLKAERDQLRMNVAKLQKENATTKFLNGFPASAGPRLVCSMSPVRVWRPGLTVGVCLDGLQ